VRLLAAVKREVKVKEAVTFFVKKVTKKTFALRRGRAAAGVRLAQACAGLTPAAACPRRSAKVFLVLFLQKKNGFIP